MGAVSARGYKGSGITLLVEIITGALVGAKMGKEAKIDPIDWSEFGGLLICLDITSFTDIQVFKRSVTQMRDQIRKSKPQKGFDKVKLPGDRGYERMEKVLKLGWIEIEEEVVEKLRLLVSAG